MLEIMLPTITGGVFALFGVLLSFFLERERRKEQLLNTIFDKKVEAYTSIIQATHEVTYNDILQRNYESMNDSVMKLLLKFGDYALFTSDEVTRLTSEYALATAKADMEIEEKQQKMSTLHRALRRQCQKELGVAKLQKKFLKQ